MNNPPWNVQFYNSDGTQHRHRWWLLLLPRLPNYVSAAFAADLGF
jgi:hypothetical protein